MSADHGLILESLGPGFLAAFTVLTGLALYYFSQTWERAGAVELGADAVELASEQALEARRLELSHRKGALRASLAQTRVAMSLAPLVAFFGTCKGFMGALITTAALELGSTGPMALFQALLDGGVKTALVTTVVGYGIYILNVVFFLVFLAGRTSRALSVLEDQQEHLGALARGWRLSRVESPDAAPAGSRGAA